MDTQSVGAPDLDARKAAIGSDGPDLTIEVALYALIAGVALLARLYRPAWMPLDPSEAGLTLAATHDAAAGVTGAAAASPLLFQLERLALWLFGQSDATARIVPTLAGAIAVVLAFRLRPALGRPGALAAAALLAFSPLWVYLGRNVSAPTIAAAAVLAVLGAAVSRFSRDAWLAPVAAGLAIAAGGPALTMLIALLAYAAWRYLGPGRLSLSEDLDLLWPTPGGRRTALIVLVVTVVLAVTGFLTRVDGLAALVAAPGAWFARFTAPDVDRGAFLLSFVAYGPALLVFGVVGIGMAARSDRPLNRFLALWAVIGLVVGWLAGAPSGMGDCLLPLTLVGAIAVGRLLEQTADHFRWLEDGAMTGILLVVVAYGVMQFWAFSKAADIDLGSQNWFLAVGSLAMGAVLVVLFALLWGAPVAFRAAAWAVVVALGILAWSNGSELAYRTTQFLREPMRPEYTAPGAHGLATAAATASWTRAGDPNAWAAVADPSLQSWLEWELRGREVTWSAPGETVEAPLVVVPSGQAAKFGPAPYRGQTYGVGGTWRPIFQNRHEFARWLFHRRDGLVGPTVENVRADLYVNVEVVEGEG
jgi:hypothetical protein